MAIEKATQEGWVQRPGGGYVSSGRMLWNGESFRLYHAANMNIDGFNKRARQYDVQPIKQSDPPIDRLVRASVLRSRMDEDDSFIPINAQYIDMALEVATAKARYDELMKKDAATEAQRFKPMADFYQILKTGPVDAVAELLQFHERLVGGRNNGKYKATPHVFNRDGRLEPADDAIIIAPEGWQKTLGRRGYPTDTVKEDQCLIENIEVLALSDTDLQGYWFVGSEPVGQQRIVLRGPGWRGGRLLDASVLEGRSYFGQWCGRPQAPRSTARRLCGRNGKGARGAE